MVSCVRFSLNIDIASLPEKENRKRFALDIVGKLHNLQWWNWPENKIRDAISAIMCCDIDILDKL